MVLTGNVTSTTLTFRESPIVDTGTRCIVRLQQNAVGGWAFRLPAALQVDGELVIDPRPLRVTILPMEYNGRCWVLLQSERPVSWSYLVSDQWRPLKDTNLLSDTTDGFLSSGIVTLEVPEDIDREHTIMSRELYWLRASARRNFASFCSVYEIRAQAAEVTRKLTEQAPKVMSKPLPANSMKGPVISIPAFAIRPSAARVEPGPRNGNAAAKDHARLREAAAQGPRHNRVGLRTAGARRIPRGL